MANLFEHKDRRVVPNWRSFGNTTVLGELNSFQVPFDNTSGETNIDEYIFDWQVNKTVVYASDLLSAAIVNGQTKNGYVKQAATFILKNKDKASKSQISLANKILNESSEVNISDYFKEVNLSNLSYRTNPELIRVSIREAKLFLNSFPYNSINYVELSRYYSILGQERQSIEAMRIALHLAPNNRFVLRCATRLFAHYHNDKNDYLSFIQNILRKSPMTSLDPWLTSAEISVATMRNKTSTLIKKGIELINSKNISPFSFTELASSIGTVELLNGSTKRSREFFSKSLINPNDNSLAQIEWASSKDQQLNINPAQFEVKMNFEALALDCYHNSEFNLALDYAVKWFVDMPFSKRPIMFGSNLSSSILKDQNKSISLLNAGLVSHPNDPQLINNIAYALALDNKPEKAFEQLEKIKDKTDYSEVTRICLTATKGLAYFRSGFADIGRKMYLDAIVRTKQIKNQELNWIALLNYAREEILIGSDYIKPIMDEVAKIPSTSREVEIRFLKKDVIDLYEKKHNIQ